MFRPNMLETCSRITAPDPNRLSRDKVLGSGAVMREHARLGSGDRGSAPVTIFQRGVSRCSPVRDTDRLPPVPCHSVLKSAQWDTL